MNVPATPPVQTPFDSVENAQTYIRLLIEALIEAKQEIEDDVASASGGRSERRLQATFRAATTGACNIILNLLLSLDKRLNQEANVGLGILHTVERSLNRRGRRNIHRSRVLTEKGIRIPDTFKV